MNSKPIFFLPQYKRREIRTFIFTQLSVQELYSAQWGRTRKSPYSQMKTYLHFSLHFHLKGSPCQNEKNKCLKKIIEWYF